MAQPKKDLITTDASRPRRRRRSFGAVERLPSGRFRARVMSATGRYINAPITFNTRTEAAIWIDIQRADMVRGAWKAPRIVRESVEDYVARWIEQHPTAKESTRELYRGILQACIVPDLGSLPLCNLRPDVVRKWHHELGERLERQALARRSALISRGRQPSARSVADGRTRQAQAYRLLRAAMTTAVTDGLLTEQPCRVRGAGTPRRSVLRSERDLAERLLTPAQVAGVADEMPRRYRALILAAAWSGLRQGELLALRRSDLSLDGDLPVVRVRRRVRRLDSGETDIDTPKTIASQRTVVLPDPLARILQCHLEEFVPDDASALVFSTSLGTVPARSNLADTVQRAMRKAGVPQVRFHDLRHVAQVFAAENGATTAELMQRMGHTSSAAALIYMHARPEHSAALARRLGEHMKSGLDPLLSSQSSMDNVNPRRVR